MGQDMAETNDAYSCLRHMVSLAELSDDEVCTLASIGTIDCYPQGTIMFSEGDLHGKIYFLASGSVRLQMLTHTGARQTILSLGAGDLLAWSSLVGDQIMTATAVVVDDALAVWFPASRLKELLETQPVLGYRLMTAVAQALSRRLLATRLQLLDLYDDIGSK